MAFACDICSKKHQSGHNVSHANNKTKRTSNSNLQRDRAVADGSTRRIRVCTRCLRSGKVRKALCAVFVTVPTTIPDLRGP